MKRWIERQKNVIDFTLSSLFRRKGKNTALILVYTLVVFMAGLCCVFYPFDQGGSVDSVERLP